MEIKGQKKGAEALAAAWSQAALDPHSNRACFLISQQAVLQVLKKATDGVEIAGEEAWIIDLPNSG